MASAVEDFKATRATPNEMSVVLDDTKAILVDMATKVAKLIEKEEKKKTWAAVAVRSTSSEAS